MATLTELMNPVTVARKIRQHGFYKLARTATKPWQPLADAERRAETSLLRARHSGQVRRRKEAAAQAVSANANYKGFVSREDRFRALRPAEIPGMAEVRDYCFSVYQKRMKEAQALGQTYTSLFAPSIGNFQTGLVSDVRGHRIVQDFATSPAMTAIVADYLGEIPVLRDLSLSVTHPNASKEGSQRFHCDYSPLPHLKFYLNVCDVDDTCGPLTWLSAPDTTRVKRRTGYRMGRIEDADVAAVVPESNWRQHKGPAGSAAFVDVSRCLHFGSRGNQRDRVTLIIFYDPLFARGGIDHMIEVAFDKSAADTPQKKLLIDASA